LPSADSYEALIRQAQEQTQPEQTVRPVPDRLQPEDTPSVRLQAEQNLADAMLHHSGRQITPRPSRGPGGGYSAMARQRSLASHPLWNQRVAENTVLGLAAFPMLSEKQARAAAEVLTSWSIEDPDLTSIIEQDFAEAMMSASSTGNFEGPAGELFGEALAVVSEVASAQALQKRQDRLNRIYSQAKSPVEVAAAVTASSPAEVDNHLWGRLAAMAKASILDSVTLGLFDASAATVSAVAADKAGANLSQAQEQEIRNTQRARVSPVLAAATLANIMVSEGVNRRDAANQALAAMDELTEDEKAILQRNIADFTADEIIAQAEAEGDPFQSEIDRQFEIFSTQTFNSLALWDGVAQAITVELTSLADEVFEAIPGLREFLFNESNPVDRPTLVQRLMDGDTEGAKEAWDELVAEGVGGWYGLEGAQRAWANIIGGVFFDPLNAFTLGGGAVAGDVATALARNPEQILKHPGFRGIVRDAVAAGSDNAIPITQLGDGLSTSAKARILSTTNPEEITEILLDELVNGHYVPDPTYMVQRRHTALGLGKAATNLGDNKVADFLVDFLKRSRYGRTINTGEAHVTQEIEEMVLFRYGNDQEKAAAVLSSWYDLANEQEFGRIALRTEAMQRADFMESELAELEELKNTPLAQVPWVEDALDGRRGFGLDARLGDEALTRNEEVIVANQDKLEESVRQLADLQANTDETVALSIEELIGVHPSELDGPELAGILETLAPDGNWLFHGSGTGNITELDPGVRGDVGFFTTSDPSYAMNYMDQEGGKMFVVPRPPPEQTLDLSQDVLPEVGERIVAWVDSANEWLPQVYSDPQDFILATQVLEGLREVGEQFAFPAFTRARHIGDRDLMMRWAALVMGKVQVGQDLARWAGEVDSVLAGQFEFGDLAGEIASTSLGSQEVVDAYWDVVAGGYKAVKTTETLADDTFIWRNPPDTATTTEALGENWNAMFDYTSAQFRKGRIEGDIRYRSQIVDEQKEIFAIQKEAHEGWLARKEGVQQILEEQRRILEELDRPKDRKWVYDFLDQYYDDWAEEIGVPRLPNGEFDWGLIRNGQSSQFVRPGAAGPDRLDAIALNDDHKRILAASGALNAGSNYSLPASPYHMTLWANASAKDRGKVIETFKKVADGTGQSLHFLNRIFAAAVLLNPLTPLKSALDEVVRFAQETAGTKGFARALESTFRQNVDNPRALAHSREVVNPLTHTTQRWHSVAKGEPGHAVAAERWLNGTLRQDPIVREVARAIQSGDVQGFLRWWDEIGSGGEKRMVAISLKPGSPPTPTALTGQMVYDAVVASLDGLGGQASPTWRSSVIGYLADNEEIPMAIARQSGPVPTQETLSAGVTGRAFDLLYGRPSQRRSALFFDHRYRYLDEVFEARFEGRFAEDNLQMLVDEGLARDLDHARQIFEQRHPQVDEFFQSRGVTTRGYSREVAAQSAGRWADDMMYTMGGVSRGGRSAQLLVPFGPAQFDFYSWWARELNRYTTFALPFSGLAGTAGAKMPGQLGEILGKYAGARATAPIPLNLRLLSRITHFPVSAERDDDPTKFEATPTDILQTLTFLPVKWDPDNFLLDFGPGLGPIPNWIIGMLPTDNKFRETLETFMPAVEFIEGQAWDPRRYFLPSSSRSLPGVFQLMTRGATALDGGDGIITDMFSALSHELLAQESRPYGFSDYYKSQIGQKLMDDPWWDPALDMEGLNGLIDSALAESAGEEAGDRLTGLFGWRPQFGADGLNPELYFGMVDDLQFLQDFGIIGDAQADELRELKEQLTVEGGQDTNTVRFFAESSRELLFSLEDEWQDYVVARHPEVAVNMVSSLQCAVDDRGNSKAPAEYCRPDGTVNFSIMPPGLEGDRLRRHGTENGWWGPRPETEIALDAVERISSARRRLINTIYEAATGTQWPGASRISDKVANSTYQFSDFHREVMQLAGVEIHNGMTGAMLAASVEAARDRLPSPPTLVGSDSPLDRFMLQSPDLGPIRDWIKSVEDAGRQSGFDSPFDWPEDAKEDVRQVYAEAAILDPEIVPFYNREARRYFGPLDFEAVQPPTVEDLETFWTARPQQVFVVDADTLRVVTRRGDLRIRIIGINAPEQGQTGYLESKDSLIEVLKGAGEITIGMHRPELFGSTQVVSPEGEKRLIAWVYIDGVPLYDPSNFTATNPQGIDIGGDPLDLLDLLRQRQEERNGTELATTG